MRRLLTVLVSALLVLMLLLPAGASAAGDVAGGDGVVLLATEAEGGEAPGVTPPGPDSPENPNPPDPYEAPFLQNAAKGLVTILLLTVAALGGLYYLMVQRPRTAARQ